MDRSGRLLGIIVFIIGIAILLFVFSAAFRMFTSSASDIIPSVSGSPPADAAGLGAAVIVVLVKVILLFVMTIAASAIAGRGIQLYGSSKDRESQDG